MGIEEMKKIADFIDRAIQNRLKDEVLAEISGEVAAFCENFPLYAERRKEE
jgi:glycine hydroxymethyltransferase